MMSRSQKRIQNVLTGNRDKNIRFKDLRLLLNYLGFKERIKGDHFIFTKSGVTEIINLQPYRRIPKPYQVKQVRNLIMSYNLEGTDTKMGSHNILE